MFMTVLRRNIGTVIAALGFFVLCILTFGNIGDVLTENYWHNVLDNITSIGFMSISLTMIQVTIKQGLSEQALQRGLNTEKTREKYSIHRAIIQKNIDKMVYMPYFLQIYNKRLTELRQREFVISNGFKSYAQMAESKKKRKLVKLYNRIRVKITLSSIKWATTDIVYTKDGRIETLATYRARRMTKAILVSLVCMFALTLITKGLFFDKSNEPFWQKLIKLLMYVISIVLTSVFNVVKEYEKGAFGVPNELDEINEIWHEFESWTVPEWVTQDVLSMNKEVENDERRHLQEE